VQSARHEQKVRLSICYHHEQRKETRYDAESHTKQYQSLGSTSILPDLPIEADDLRKASRVTRCGCPGSEGQLQAEPLSRSRVAGDDHAAIGLSQAFDCIHRERILYLAVSWPADTMQLNVWIFGLSQGSRNADVDGIESGIRLRPVVTRTSPGDQCTQVGRGNVLHVRIPGIDSLDFGLYQIDSGRKAWLWRIPLPEEGRRIQDLRYQPRVERFEILLDSPS